MTSTYTDPLAEDYLQVGCPVCGAIPGEPCTYRGRRGARFHIPRQTKAVRRGRAGKMEPAPGFDCAACGRRIGKRGSHNITDDHRVICTRCMFDRRLHARFWPTCPHGWHDMFDHTPSVAGTRAGVAALLGLWPDQQEPVP